MSSDRRIVVCHFCHGSGEVTRTGGISDDDLDMLFTPGTDFNISDATPSEEFTNTCMECGGSGELVEVYEEYVSREETSYERTGKSGCNFFVILFVEICQLLKTCI